MDKVMMMMRSRRTGLLGALVFLGCLCCLARTVQKLVDECDI